MLHRVDSMTARLRHSKQVVTKVMRWGAEFGLVVEQKPLPANKTRLFNSAFFRYHPHRDANSETWHDILFTPVAQAL